MRTRLKRQPNRPSMLAKPSMTAGLWRLRGGSEGLTDGPLSAVYPPAGTVGTSRRFNCCPPTVGPPAHRSPLDGTRQCRRRAARKAGAVLTPFDLAILGRHCTPASLSLVSVDYWGLPPH